MRPSETCAITLRLVCANDGCLKTTSTIDYPKIWSCSAIFLKRLGQIHKPPQWKPSHVQLQASATSRSSQSLYCDPLWSAFPCAQTSMLWLAAWRSQANVTTGKRPVFEVFEASSVLYKGDGYIALLSVGSWSSMVSWAPSDLPPFWTTSLYPGHFGCLNRKSSWSLAASHGVRWSVGTAPCYEKAISRESHAVKVTTKSAKHIGKLVCVCINVCIYIYMHIHIQTIWISSLIGFWSEQPSTWLWDTFGRCICVGPPSLPVTGLPQQKVLLSAISGLYSYVQDQSMPNF